MERAGILFTRFLEPAEDMTEKLQEFNTILEELDDSSPKVAQLIRHLSDQLDEKEARIQILENCVNDLESRMLQQERYSSKDCIVITNMPYNSSDLTEQVVEFLNANVSTSLRARDIKACHFLADPRDQCHPAPIIVEFLYYRDKDVIWLNKKLLKGLRNPNNNKPVFINERLPPNDRIIQQYANSKDLLTVTNKCAVHVLVESSNGRPQHVEVRTKKQVDDLAGKAIMKRNRQQGDRTAARQQTTQREFQIIQQKQMQPPTLMYKGVERYKRPLERSSLPRAELFEKIRACKEDKELEVLLNHYYITSPTHKCPINLAETPIRSSDEFRNEEQNN